MLYRCISFIKRCLIDMARMLEFALGNDFLKAVFPITRIPEKYKYHFSIEQYLESISNLDVFIRYLMAVSIFKFTLHFFVWPLLGWKILVESMVLMGLFPIQIFIRNQVLPNLRNKVNKKIVQSPLTINFNSKFFHDTTPKTGLFKKPSKTKTPSKSKAINTLKFFPEPISPSTQKYPKMIHKLNLPSLNSPSIGGTYEPKWNENVFHLIVGFEIVVLVIFMVAVIPETVSFAQLIGYHLMSLNILLICLYILSLEYGIIVYSLFGLSLVIFDLGLLNDNVGIFLERIILIVLSSVVSIIIIMKFHSRKRSCFLSGIQKRDSDQVMWRNFVNGIPKPIIVYDIVKGYVVLRNNAYKELANTMENSTDHNFERLMRSIYRKPKSPESRKSQFIRNRNPPSIDDMNQMFSDLSMTPKRESSKSIWDYILKLKMSPEKTFIFNKNFFWKSKLNYDQMKLMVNLNRGDFFGIQNAIIIYLEDITKSTKIQKEEDIEQAKIEQQISIHEKLKNTEEIVVQRIESLKSHINRQGLLELKSIIYIAFLQSIRLQNLFEYLYCMKKESDCTNFSFSLHELIIEIRQVMKRFINFYEISFEINEDYKIHPKISADRNKLKLILTNLLLYSFHTTEKGFISLKVLKDKGKISFQIEDSGRGLTSEEYNQIFYKIDEEKEFYKNLSQYLEIRISYFLLKKINSHLTTEVDRIGVKFSFVIYSKVRNAVTIDESINFGLKPPEFIKLGSNRRNDIFLIEDQKEIESSLESSLFPSIPSEANFIPNDQNNQSKIGGLFHKNKTMANIGSPHNWLLVETQVLLFDQNNSVESMKDLLSSNRHVQIKEIYSAIDLEEQFLNIISSRKYSITKILILFNAKVPNILQHITKINRLKGSHSLVICAMNCPVELKEKLTKEEIDYIFTNPMTSIDLERVLKDLDSSLSHHTIQNK